MSTISPTAPQFDYMMSTDLFPAMVAGFGAGKTEAAVMRCIIGKLRNPTTDRGFYLPTYDLVRTIAFPRFEEALETMKIPYRLYKSPLNMIVIPNCGKIIFRSMDSPHRIIGYQHADADCDELDTLKKDDAAEVWRRVLSRNRQKKPDGSPNTVGVTTTPEGFKFVHEAWKASPRKGHVIIQAPTYSNPHLPEGYIDILRDQYPAALLEAYVEGLFVNLTSGTVYHTFDRVLNNCDDVEKDGEKLFVGMDFNVENMAAIINVKRDGKPRAVNEFTGVFDTGAMIKLLKDRYPRNTLVIYPDASGQNRKTVDASTNDIALLKQAGFMVVVNPANPSVKDRVTASTSAFCNANGERLYLINVERCPELAKCAEQQPYDKYGQPCKKSGFDHPLDAMGYFIVKDYPIMRPIMIPRFRRHGR
jgi:hypothetical protein